MAADSTTITTTTITNKQSCMPQHKRQRHRSAASVSPAAFAASLTAMQYQQTSFPPTLDNSNNLGARQQRRQTERGEEWLNQWAHIWTKRQSPEWKPRRASVAACQHQQFQLQQQHLNLFHAQNLLRQKEKPENTDSGATKCQVGVFYSSLGAAESAVAELESTQASEISHIQNVSLHKPQTTTAPLACASVCDPATIGQEKPSNEIAGLIPLEKETTVSPTQQPPASCSKVAGQRVPAENTGHLFILPADEEKKSSKRRSEIAKSQTVDKIRKNLTLCSDELTSGAGIHTSCSSFKQPTTATTTTTTTTTTSTGLKFNRSTQNLFQAEQKKTGEEVEKASEQKLPATCCSSTKWDKIEEKAAPDAISSKCQQQSRPLNMKEQFESQEKQRKFLILSMALKRMISNGSLSMPAQVECVKCSTRDGMELFAVGKREKPRAEIKSVGECEKSGDHINGRGSNQLKSTFKHQTDEKVREGKSCGGSLKSRQRSKRRTRELKAETSTRSNKLDATTTTTTVTSNTKVRGSSSESSESLTAKESRQVNDKISSLILKTTTIMETDTRQAHTKQLEKEKLLDQYSSSGSSSSDLEWNNSFSDLEGELKIINDSSVCDVEIGHAHSNTGDQELVQTFNAIERADGTSKQADDDDDDDENLTETITIMPTSVTKQGANLRGCCGVSKSFDELVEKEKKERGISMSEDLIKEKENQEEEEDCDLNLESLIIESWLDDHPKFVHDYFVRKATDQLIDDWLISNAKLNTNTNVSSRIHLTVSNNNNNNNNNQHNHIVDNQVQKQQVTQIMREQHQQQQQRHPTKVARICLPNISLSSECIPTAAAASETTLTPPSTEEEASAEQQPTFIPPSAANILRSDSSLGSGCVGPSATPVRKISATDFESRTGSGFLRPMVSTTPDGRPTFLQSSLLGDVLGDDHYGTLHLEHKKHSVQEAGESEDTTSTGACASSPNAQSIPSTLIDIDESNQIAAPADSAAITIEGVRRVDANQQLFSNYDDEGDVTSIREVKLIFELVKNICNDLDIRTLLHKILKNIAVLINADKSSLFLVCGHAGDPNRHLVSQLFNVDQDSEVENQNFQNHDQQEHQQPKPPNTSARNEQQNKLTDPVEGQDCIRIPWGTGLVGYVAQSGESLNIANCYDDPRFTNTVDKKTGYITRHMLCAPIFDKRNEIVGVAQVINKRDGNPFTKRDEIKFNRYLQFCGIGLRNAQSYEQSQLENRRNQVLLDLARMVFEEQSTIEQVVYRIMLHIQSLLECQRCQVLLIDDGSDDLDQLLQLPNCYDIHHQNQQQSDLTIEDQKVQKPKWEPQCSQMSGGCSNSSSVSNESEVYGDIQISTQATNMTKKSKQDEVNECGTRSSRRKKKKKKLFSLVFDLECEGNDLVMHSNKEEGKNFPNQQRTCQAKDKRQKFPINIGITGYVAMTGETLNIKDAHKSERFDPSVDEGSSFRHKSILCMPIRNGQRQIIGVSQLINKKNGRPFNKNDEDLFEAFAIFCGLGIHNTLMYEKVLKIMAKQRVTFEVLSYHATAPLEEAKKLNLEQIPSCFSLNLTSLKFDDFSLDDQFMLKSCVRFFLDLDLMRRFQIDQLVFCNWILSVQKNYRKVNYHPIVGGNGLKASPVRYHNWRHAFNVSQMMFSILIICQALGELETLALLIACLCHDLDHRGTNNSFQIKSASPLAELYSTSTMEHHHFDQCIMILNSQGNQILANLSPEEYSRVITLLEEAILATDLANYFQKRELFFQLVDSNQFDWQYNPEHRSLLRCMLMTACDVAAITKPWSVQKVVADLVMSEFYQQGDIEKQELNIEPIDMMNRDKMSKLPEMQIKFIDSICAPIYTAFAKLFPNELGSLLDSCLSNRAIWTEMAQDNNINNNNNNNNNTSKLPSVPPTATNKHISSSPPTSNYLNIKTVSPTMTSPTDDPSSVESTKQISVDERYQDSNDTKETLEQERLKTNNLDSSSSFLTNNFNERLIQLEDLNYNAQRHIQKSLNFSRVDCLRKSI